MADKGSRFEVECPYCLQPFRMPVNTSQVQTVICPFCGYRQFTLGNQAQELPTGGGQSSGVVFLERSEVLVGSVVPGEGPLPFQESALPEIARGADQDFSISPCREGTAVSMPVVGGLQGGEDFSPVVAVKSASNEGVSTFLPDGAEGGAHRESSSATDGGEVAVAPVTVAPIPKGTLGSLSRDRRGNWAVGVALGVTVALFLGFLSGFWVGKYTGRDTGDGSVRVAHGGRVPGGVLVQGRLTYRPDPLSGRPDAGAVVILLPADRTPTETIPVAGLRVHETLRMDSPGYLAVNKFGGAVERTGAGGEFMLVVVPGTYHVLLISRSAHRPAGEPIRPSDLAEMRKYFYAAEDLVGPSKYFWGRYRFTEAEHTLDYNFGLDQRNQTYDPLRELTQ